MALNLNIPVIATKTLSGLAITANVGSIGLSWDPSQPGGLQNIEVWRHTSNDRSGATLITTTLSDTYTDVDFADDTDYYYWIRAKNIFGTYGAWHPTSSTGGVHVLSLTAPTVSSLLDTTLAVSSAGAVAGSGGTSISVSGYGTWYEADCGTWTPFTGSGFVAYNELSLDYTLGTPASGSDANTITVWARFRLYNNTNSTDVPNYWVQYRIASYIKISGVWNSTIYYPAMVAWPNIISIGFLGPANSTKEYKMKAGIMVERTGTGTLSISNANTSFSFSASYHS